MTTYAPHRATGARARCEPTTLLCAAEGGPRTTQPSAELGGRREPAAEEWSHRKVRQCAHSYSEGDGAI